MPKYQIAETLRVQFVIDDENANSAIGKYMNEFLLLFNTERKIQCMEGADFTVHLVNEDGTLGYEVDPEESDSKDGV